MSVLHLAIWCGKQTKRMDPCKITCHLYPGYFTVPLLGCGTEEWSKHCTWMNPMASPALSPLKGVASKRNGPSSTQKSAESSPFLALCDFALIIRIPKNEHVFAVSHLPSSRAVGSPPGEEDGHIGADLGSPLHELRVRGRPPGQLVGCPQGCGRVATAASETGAGGDLLLEVDLQEQRERALGFARGFKNCFLQGPLHCTKNASASQLLRSVAAAAHETSNNGHLLIEVDLSGRAYGQDVCVGMYGINQARPWGLHCKRFWWCPTRALPIPTPRAVLVGACWRVGH
jgi:hypothetical protein